ncbi:MAG: UDP-N-acetylmuramoyl-L-alanine--D-glutamate ligase, partial [Patescibacteria group bacterium]
VEILDQKQNPDYLKNLERFDLVFRSPGVPYNLPELVRARRRGIKFSSGTKLFFERCPATIIGITGTKGKGTVSTLLAEMLRAAGREVFLVGNIGLPAITVLSRVRPESLVVFELSSFQLQDLTVSPSHAVILDLFPDHQDSHRDLREYYRAKSNLVRFQKPSDSVFVFNDSPRARAMAKLSRGKKFLVTAEQERLLRPTDLLVTGPHHFRNAVMAAAVARKLNVSEASIKRVAKQFRGLEHRLELVKKIGPVSVYNDSAATNPGAAAAAVRSFPSANLILITGGQSKGLDYAPLVRAVKNSAVKLVILFGANRRELTRAFKPVTTRVVSVTTLNEALAVAWSFVKNLSTREAGETANGSAVVLFAPGAASFDQFTDYAARGREFKRLVDQIT